MLHPPSFDPSLPPSLLPCLPPFFLSYSSYLAKQSMSILSFSPLTGLAAAWAVCGPGGGGGIAIVHGVSAWGDRPSHFLTAHSSFYSPNVTLMCPAQKGAYKQADNGIIVITSVCQCTILTLLGLHTTQVAGRLAGHGAHKEHGRGQDEGRDRELHVGLIGRWVVEVSVWHVWVWVCGVGGAVRVGLGRHGGEMHGEGGIRLGRTNRRRRVLALLAVLVILLHALACICFVCVCRTSSQRERDVKTTPTCGCLKLLVAR